MSELTSQELLALIAHGDRDATNVVFDRYVDRLRALVRERIGSKLRRRIDADDVVQSAYRSFFVHAENGEYTATNAGDLWRLLASIALHKLYGQIEKHTAARRSIGREEAATASSEPEYHAPVPTPGEAVAVAEQLHLLARRLTADQQAALFAYLRGESLDSIAASLEKSPRTIRRLLADAQQLF
jgi:RNA polymerase sigma-70 factor (ECF subfamily)